MIIKSYQVQKNKSDFLKYNFFLFYGENVGLKKDIRKLIKNEIEKKIKIQKFYLFTKMKF